MTIIKGGEKSAPKGFRKRREKRRGGHVAYKNPRGWRKSRYCLEVWGKVGPRTPEIFI